MLMLGRILGYEIDPELSSRLDKLKHEGMVEYVILSEFDVGRRRLRLSTDHGTDCAITFERDGAIRDGAVLYIDQARAIVVRVGAPEQMKLRARNQEAALRLGWNAGNLHWRVSFNGPELIVTLDGPRSGYLERISTLISDGSVEVDDGGDH